MFGPFISGAAFGAALTAAGIQEPELVVAQMQLGNWAMAEMFLTAAGASTLLVTLARHLTSLPFAPRGPASLHLFAPLDGNLVGGALLGAGMALAGSCPGTVYAQVGAGVPSGPWTLAGLLLGGIAYAGWLRGAIAKHKTSSSSSSSSSPAPPREIQHLLGLASPTLGGLAVAALFAGLVAAIARGHHHLPVTNPAGAVSPLVGGLLVAGAQAVSLAARARLLGTSTSFEEFGDLFWRVVGGRRRAAAKPAGYASMVLASGMVAGALAVARGGLGPAAAAAVAGSSAGMVISPARAVLGGVLMTVGSRMGGGCTSGHGISGIALLSVSSFVTVAAMFAGGMATAALVR
ncbi:hypothetical protein F4780DRAFT_779038 [Xylariomycetidae sp. FL0641]|nr:hypothetical protein F4780DRAFT_779038 [Xylariomycetidae sp. FL0641]